MTLMSGSGCVFEYGGRVPHHVYDGASFSSPLEEAVFKDDAEAFKTLVENGHDVTVKLRIGSMTCIEYAAMMGYMEILRLLVQHSVNTEMVKKYLSMKDIVEQANLISAHKKIFFDHEALAEINRYEAALFTAIEYNQPQVVELMLDIGAKSSNIHKFLVDNKPQALSIKEFAKLKGHTECITILEKRLPEKNNNN